MNDEELAGTSLVVYEKKVESSNTRTAFHRLLSFKTYIRFYDFSSSEEIAFLNYRNKRLGTFDLSVGRFLSVLGYF